MVILYGVVATFDVQFYKCRTANKCNSLTTVFVTKGTFLSSQEDWSLKDFFWKVGGGGAKFLIKIITMHKELKRMAVRFKF